MPDTSLIGFLAATASTASFAPQAWKIIRSRDTSSLSAAMYSVTVAGFFLWFLYGFELRSLALMISNAICLMLSAFILLMTLLSQTRKEAVAKSMDPLPSSQLMEAETEGHRQR